MKVKDLLTELAKCDPNAEVIPGNGSFSHYVAPFHSCRQSKALETTKTNPMKDYRDVPPTLTKYLEMPDTGKVNVVVIL